MALSNYKTINTHKGFSLLELMIAVVVISILASIAIPAYQDSVRKGRRADAQLALMGLASSMERFFTDNNTYAGAGAGSVNCTAPLLDPTVFGQNVPLDGGDVYYRLCIGPVTATTFTLTAVRTGSMANDTKCGDFTLTSTGVQGRTGTDALDACWR